jgi:hypothetical protein
MFLSADFNKPTCYAGFATSGIFLLNNYKTTLGIVAGILRLEFTMEYWREYCDGA